MKPDKLPIKEEEIPTTKTYYQGLWRYKVGEWFSTELSPDLEGAAVVLSGIHHHESKIISFELPI